MKQRQAFVIQRSDGRFIGKVYSNHLNYDDWTKDETKGMRFYDEGEAWEWLLNSVHAPLDTDNFKVVPMKITYELGARVDGKSETVSKDS